MPARRSASPPGSSSPPTSAVPPPIATRPIVAIWPRSPAPTLPPISITGWTPALSMSRSTSATAGLAPEPPRASPASRASIAARTTSVGAVAPTP